MIMQPEKHRGFTLIELQIASLLMVLILIATGIVFYFSLNSIRFLNDAFEVYYNANNASQAISGEIMKANCYGWSQGPSWTGSLPINSFYGPGGKANPTLMPTIGSMPSTSDHIYLRSAHQASTVRGEHDSLAFNFDSHEVILFSLGNEIAPTETIPALFVNWNGSFAPVGSGNLVAEDITALTFYAISYNCVGFSLEVTGRVPDPLTGNYNVIRLNKTVTLRCAPLECPVPQATGGVW